jgi:hypothetical protein
MKKENVTRKNILKPQKRNFGLIAATVSLLIILGMVTFLYLNCSKASQKSNLGTYDDPEVAFRETQKALTILSLHLKSGIESVQYIQEYDNSKNLIFKEQK